jgi:hypothetical protein
MEFEFEQQYQHYHLPVLIKSTGNTTYDTYISNNNDKEVASLSTLACPVSGKNCPAQLHSV